MKTLIIAALRCSLMFLVTASPFFGRPAQAYTVTLEQVGANVVATGNGPINLTGLTFNLIATTTPGVAAVVGQIQTGPFSGPLLDFYSGFTGPPNFGSGFANVATDGSGDFVGIFSAFGLLEVPHGYVSGAALSDSMIFNSATFVSLGVTPGTYVWSWGTGLPNQNFTLIIGGAGVPDGGSTVSLLSCALLGLVSLRRKLSC
jgi:hypothetical protein